VTTCTPIKPFRCWQYRKDSGEAVPEWVNALRMTRYITEALDGWWLVEFEEGASVWRLYTPAEFAERFKIVEDEPQAQHKFKATCCKCGKVDWRDEPVTGVYFCGYGCT
jgi:hypothetical protein